MVEMIGDNISIEETDERLSIIIDGRLPRLKESLLLAWLLVWAALGAYVLYELKTVEHPKEMKLTLNVYLVFWAYFLFKIGKAFFWSRAGREMIWLQDGHLNIKNSIQGYGRSNTYAIENVSDIEVSSMKRDSFQYQVESSFWMIGGERMQFKHFGKMIRLGKKIEDKTASSMVRRLKKKIKKMKQISAQIESD